MEKISGFMYLGLLTCGMLVIYFA